MGVHLATGFAIPFGTSSAPQATAVQQVTWALTRAILFQPDVAIVLLPSNCFLAILVAPSRVPMTISSGFLGDLGAVTQIDWGTHLTEAVPAFVAIVAMPMYSIAEDLWASLGNTSINACSVSLGHTPRRSHSGVMWVSCCSRKRISSSIGVLYTLCACTYINGECHDENTFAIKGDIIGRATTTRSPGQRTWLPGGC